jgi:hypothetical protein
MLTVCHRVDFRSRDLLQMSSLVLYADFHYSFCHEHRDAMFAAMELRRHVMTRSCLLCQTRLRTCPLKRVRRPLSTLKSYTSLPISLPRRSWAFSCIDPDILPNGPLTIRASPRTRCCVASNYSGTLPTLTHTRVPRTIARFVYPDVSF